METGSVVSWAKNEGDEINEGDLLAEIETDKATMSFEASDAGFLAKILAPAGTKDIPVGTPLCVVVEEADSVGAFKDFKIEASDVSPPVKKEAPAVAAAPAPAPPPPAATAKPVPAAEKPTPVAPPPGQRIFASPLARRLAADQGISLAQLAASKPGTGIHGMIRAADLTGFQPSSLGAVSGQFSDVQITDMRSVMAKRLADTQLNVPHYYLTADIAMDEVIAMRDAVNKKFNKTGGQTSADSINITLNDILIKAIGVTCSRVPECNSSWQGDFIRQYNTVDVNVAVATPEGLITPVVRAAETKGLLQINREIRELAAKARENQLEPHELQVGTFTVSNLGMFGITSFNAIINAPQACLLTVGSTHEQLYPDGAKSSGFTSKRMMSVTLCCDHRVVDGAVGAQWLAEFKSALESPALMLV